jgi:galactitol-specific phosphotransferase system IIC component
MNSDVAKIHAETWLEEIAGFEIERLAARVYDVSLRMTGVSASSSSSSSQASHFRWIVIEVFKKFDFGFALSTGIRITRSATWSASISAGSLGCEILRLRELA